MKGFPLLRRVRHQDRRGPVGNNPQQRLDEVGVATSQRAAL